MRVGVVEDKQSNDLSYGKYTNWDTLGGWVLNSIYSFWVYGVVVGRRLLVLYLVCVIFVGQSISRAVILFP
jgi:hypothetical protein